MSQVTDEMLEAHREKLALVEQLRPLAPGLQTLSDLVNGPTPADLIEPLAQALPRLRHARNKETVARALTLKRLPADVVQLLASEYIRAADEALRWALGNALAESASPRDADLLLTLTEDGRFGPARQKLLLALPRLKADERAERVAVRALSDLDCVGHAAMALGKLGSRASLEALLAAATKTKWQQQRVDIAIRKIQDRAG